MVLHRAFRARCVWNKHGIGGDVRHGVTSGVAHFFKVKIPQRTYMTSPRRPRPRRPRRPRGPPWPPRPPSSPAPPPPRAPVGGDFRWNFRRERPLKDTFAYIFLILSPKLSSGEPSQREAPINAPVGRGREGHSRALRRQSFRNEMCCLCISFISFKWILYFEGFHVIVSWLLSPYKGALATGALATALESESADRYQQVDR